MKHKLIKITYEEYHTSLKDYEHYCYFKCKNCGAMFENNLSSISSYYYGYGKYRGYEDLTCEEVIIKQIVE